MVGHLRVPQCAKARSGSSAQANGLPSGTKKHRSTTRANNSTIGTNGLNAPVRAQHVETEPSKHESRRESRQQSTPKTRSRLRQQNKDAESRTTSGILRAHPHPSSS